MKKVCMTCIPEKISREKLMCQLKEELILKFSDISEIEDGNCMIEFMDIDSMQNLCTLFPIAGKYKEMIILYYTSPSEIYSK